MPPQVTPCGTGAASKIASAVPAGSAEKWPLRAVPARYAIRTPGGRETGKPLETVLVDIERDHWLSAQEAVEYGLVPRIIGRMTELRV